MRNVAWFGWQTSQSPRCTRGSTEQKAAGQYSRLSGYSEKGNRHYRMTLPPSPPSCHQSFDILNCFCSTPYPERPLWCEKAFFHTNSSRRSMCNICYNGVCWMGWCVPAYLHRHVAKTHFKWFVSTGGLSSWGFFLTQLVTRSGHNLFTRYYVLSTFVQTHICTYCTYCACWTCCIHCTCCTKCA